MISSLLIVIATACEKGIDPISSVAPELMNPPRTYDQLPS